MGCLALLAAAVGIGVADPSLALPALVVLAVYALTNIYLTRMIGAWMERWLANRRFREIFSMLMALFAVGISVPQFSARTDARARRSEQLGYSNVLHGSGAYLCWLPLGICGACDSAREASSRSARQFAALAGEHRAVRGGICHPAAQAVSRRISE